MTALFILIKANAIKELKDGKCKHIKKVGDMSYWLQKISNYFPLKKTFEQLCVLFLVVQVPNR